MEAMNNPTTRFLPQCETVLPPDEAAVTQAVRRAAAEKRAVYPVGGATRLAYGPPSEVPGIALVTTALNRVIEHAADDMTITVEAGVTLTEVTRILALKRQRLPIDVPQPTRATIGGTIATNTFGPRRFGHRTVRDYLIGVRAVDGRGEVFAGGGRVVKNVAGYDMPRMLVGSMGTLGLITQVSLMVRPAAETAAMVAATLPDVHAAERLIARLMQSPTWPVSIDLLSSGWGYEDTGETVHDVEQVQLLAGFEGGWAEVRGDVDFLCQEWKNSSAHKVRVFDEADTPGMWQWMADLPAQLQAHVLPSRAVTLACRIAEIDPGCALLIHAGDGIVKVRLSDEAVSDLPSLLTTKLRPAAEELGGNLVVLVAEPAGVLKRDDVWGKSHNAGEVMHAVKGSFDPEGILNPGRWVF